MEQQKDWKELLERIEKNSARQARYARLQCLCSILAMVLCAAALVGVLRLLPSLSAVAVQADTVLRNIQQVSSQLALADWEGLVANLEQVSGQMANANLGSIVQEVNGLVQSSQTGLEQTMEKLNSIDFETLNKAISDLARVVEPLAALFGR